VRICAGEFKGRRLAYPKSGLRPTKDITRQAIFNSLGRNVVGARVCDLFAGGGAVGIEALSRGACEVIFVEKSMVVLQFLRRNVKGLEGAKVIRADVLRFLRKLAGADFDLVLADPPYRHSLVQQTLERVAELDVLGANGRFVIEHHKLELPVCPEGWEIVKQGRYGESWVSILRRYSE